MHSLALVLALLTSAAHGRRAQWSGRYKQGSSKTEGEKLRKAIKSEHLLSNGLAAVANVPKAAAPSFSAFAVSGPTVIHKPSGRQSSHGAFARNGDLSMQVLTEAPTRARMTSDGAVISVKGFDVWAGASPLIMDANWKIMPNEHWALVGANGCGKSTLLRAIEDVASGEKFETIQGKLEVATMSMGVLEQTAVSGSDKSLREEVMSRMARYQNAKAALEVAQEECKTGDEAEVTQLNKALAEFEAADGYTVELRVERVLKGLGFQEGEFERPCSTFSGGWQMRIGLARLLLSDPELLILDEPTNHLDAAARSWLGDYVGNYQGTVLVVSHDEPFITAAANNIAEVAGGRLEMYKSTTMDKYVKEREERQKQRNAEVEAQEREAKVLQDFINRFGAKATKASQAKDREKKLAKLEDKMEAAKALISTKKTQPKLVLAAPPPCNSVPITLERATLRHAGGQDILHDVTMTLRKGMRLVVRGPNGAGKSTLLKAIAGTLEPHEGKRTVSDMCKLGIFAQDLAQELPGDRVALDYVGATVRMFDPLIDDDRIRGVMGALGLVQDKAVRPIGYLSGGEKARVALAVFCLTPCNVLLFDEPSNHLDVQAISALVNALETYEGSIVVISHDRAFCEALNCTHVAYVAGGNVKVEERGLQPSDFKADTGISNVDMESEAAEAAAPVEVKRVLTSEEKKELRTARRNIAKLEDKIEWAEQEIERIAAEMSEHATDSGKIQELAKENEDVEAQAAEFYKEWERLNELIEAN